MLDSEKWNKKSINYYKAKLIELKEKYNEEITSEDELETFTELTIEDAYVS